MCSVTYIRKVRLPFLKILLSKVKMQMKNKIYAEDFGSLEIESLKIDYLRFNLKSYLNDSEISNLAVYFRRLGFSSYKKERDNIKERTVIFNDKYFEVTFVLRTPYYEGTHLEFAGESANHLYSFIKNNKFNWNQLEQYGTFLRRIDTCYDRPQKSTDKVTNDTFLEATLKHLKRVFPNNNLEYRRNRSGELINVGHRTSAKYYRVYLKGDLIKDLHDLLIASTFDQQDFETRLSYQFFKYSFQLFSLIIHTSHLDWLMNRIRPLQFKNTFISDISIIHSHYLNQMNLNQVKEKKHLITLLQLLVYVRGLKYNTQRLRAKYRQFRFPLHDFLKYTGKTRNQYQLNKFKDFFDLVRQNFVIESFSDTHYRMLVTIPDVYVSKSEQNIWNVEIWIAEELFDYLHPFLLTNIFQTKLTRDQFQVLFEVIQVYSSTDIRKEFHFSTFLDNYPSVINGKRKKKMKEYFIHYLQLLNQQHKLRDKVIDLSSNKSFNIHDLNTSHLNIAVFESIDIKFT